MIHLTYTYTYLRSPVRFLLCDALSNPLHYPDQALTVTCLQCLANLVTLPPSRSDMRVFRKTVTRAI